jgi:23S rRNA pseudouridine955/2504/2580 synthase
VAGDDKYGMKTYNSTLGKTGLKRLFLHAESITIPAFKGKKPMSLHAPLPEDLQDFLHSYASPGR